MFKIKYFINRKIILLIMMVIASNLNAQTITVGGSDWTVPISPITEAGIDYTGTYESVAGQISLTGSINASLLIPPSSRISVNQTNANWNNSLVLSVRRTGNGTPCTNCSIDDTSNNSTVYTPLTPGTAKTFMIIRSTNNVLIIGYTGGTYTGIPLQIRLSGVSVTVPSAAYQANIVFTISAN